MVTQFKLHDQPINIYEIEHYIVHMLSELNSNRHDGWVEEHYRKELSECGKIIDSYLQNSSEQMTMEDTKDWVKEYENEKLFNLRKKINEI